ncbi:hypothetical protein ACFLRF_05410 [Candidatus Altiarchaeota archaeon]
MEGRRVLHVLVYVLLSVILLSLGAEVIVRLFGFEPFINDCSSRIRIEPVDKLISEDPELGFVYPPGTYKAIFPSGYSHSFIILNGSTRVTRTISSYSGGEGGSGLWIFGCSYTFGESLEDNETYAWLLQETLPEYDVVNFGHMGYGTLQSLIQFRRALGEGDKPDIVIVSYASLHDDRNILSRSRSKNVITCRNFTLNLPFARFDGKKLEYGSGRLEYWTPPLIRYSALVNLVDDVYTILEEGSFRGHDVSKALLLEFSRISRGKGIVLVVAGMRSDPETVEMIQYLKGRGIHAVDVSDHGFDIKDFNQPHSWHPSPLANRKYAGRLHEYLMENVFNGSGQMD